MLILGFLIILDKVLLDPLFLLLSSLLNNAAVFITGFFELCSNFGRSMVHVKTHVFHWLLLWLPLTIIPVFIEYRRCCIALLVPSCRIVIGLLTILMLCLLLLLILISIIIVLAFEFSLLREAIIIQGMPA